MAEFHARRLHHIVDDLVRDSAVNPDLGDPETRARRNADTPPGGYRPARELAKPRGPKMVGR
jgi:hypothetical protein